MPVVSGTSGNFSFENVIFMIFSKFFFFSNWKVVVFFAETVNLDFYAREKECFVEKTQTSWGFRRLLAMFW